MTPPTKTQLETAIAVLDWLHEQNREAETVALDQLSSNSLFTQGFAHHIIKDAMQRRANTYAGIVQQLRDLHRLLSSPSNAGKAA